MQRVLVSPSLYALSGGNGHSLGTWIYRTRGGARGLLSLNYCNPLRFSCNGGRNPCWSCCSATVYGGGRGRLCCPSASPCLAVVDVGGVDTCVCKIIGVFCWTSIPKNAPSKCEILSGVEWGTSELCIRGAVGGDSSHSCGCACP